jgi:L-lysine exporter family protein LysE/ArgO
VLSVSPFLLAAAAGLGLGLSLIVAIGAQNAFVLRQGLLGEHVAAVVGVCVASDVALIVAGVAGAGAVLAAAPWAVTVVRAGGALFLLGYGVLAARRALLPAAETSLRPSSQPGAGRRGVVPVVATCLALTWLNPHVYLDTVVLLGSVGAGRGGQRWWFAVGAGTASTLWFCLLGGGAAALRPVFARPAAWRVLDALIAVVMATLGVGLLMS